MEVTLAEIRAVCENHFLAEVPGENGDRHTVQVSALGKVVGQPQLGVKGYGIGGPDGYRWLKLVRIAEAENQRAAQALANLAMEHALEVGGEPVHPPITDPTSRLTRVDPLTGKTVHGAVVDDESGELQREPDQVVIDPERLDEFNVAVEELLQETVEIRVRPPRASSLLRPNPEDPDGPRVFEDLQVVGALEPFLEMDELDGEAWEEDVEEEAEEEPAAAEG